MLKRYGLPLVAVVVIGGAGLWLFSVQSPAPAPVQPTATATATVVEVVGSALLPTAQSLPTTSNPTIVRATSNLTKDPSSDEAVTPSVAGQATSTDQAVLAPPTIAVSTTSTSRPASDQYPLPATLASGVIYQADMGNAGSFQATALGEGDTALSSRAGVLRCAAPVGGLGDGEAWIAPPQVPVIAASDTATLQTRVRSSGAAVGLAFDQGSSGANVVRLTGTNAQTFASLDRWQGHSQYLGDGTWAAATPTTKIARPFVGAWHTIEVQLTANQYQVTVDEQLIATSSRSEGGTVALYGICDQADYQSLTISK